jgi:hypothetical protein
VGSERPFWQPSSHPEDRSTSRSAFIGVPARFSSPVTKGFTYNCRERAALLVDEFSNGGLEWHPVGQPIRTETHDFVDEVLGRAFPSGSMTWQARRLVSVGDPTRTPSRRGYPTLVVLDGTVSPAPPSR